MKRNSKPTGDSAHARLFRGPWTWKGKPTTKLDRSRQLSGTEAQLYDLETQVTGAATRDEDRNPFVPGLTILGHPDWGRVGDCLPLPVLAAGRDVKLSRLEPLFRAPEQDDARPLAVAHVSRQPIRLRGGKQPGSIVLETRTVRTPVVANGEEVDDEQLFSAEEISRGVVLELGHRVTLLLHEMPSRPLKATPSLGLIGNHHHLARLRGDALDVAGLDVPVLIRGETGTGKELVARALHDFGNRSTGPFVAVSLGALSPALAASELFGAAKGAYTGADRRKTGFFQKANGGTLFLDEIGEAPAEIQVLLLRALETGEITPVGSVDSINVDARIVAATDTDLETAIAEDHFRAPLFHRLAGYTLVLSPLRERREDVGRLLFHFLTQEMGKVGGVLDVHEGRPWPPTTLIARLAGHSWPGNVRQLRNVARWLAVKGPAATADGLGALDELLSGAPASAESPASLPPRRPAVAKPPRPLEIHRSPREVTDQELLDALRLNGWQLKPTAHYLRVARTSLYALIDRNPNIRRASDLQREELARSFQAHGGDLVAMAMELEVSPQGLRSRLHELEVKLT